MRGVVVDRQTDVQTDATPKDAVSHKLSGSLTITAFVGFHAKTGNWRGFAKIELLVFLKKAKPEVYVILIFFKKCHL